MPTGIGGESNWWCPSLDDSGNGTSTLNDLVGSRSGTLTNMTPASVWTSDTGSGGVRALTFNTTNAYVDLSTAAILPSSGNLAISWWEKPASGSGSFQSRFRFNYGTGWILFRSNTSSYGTLSWGPSGTFGIPKTSPTSLSLAAGIWTHFALVGTSGAGSVTTSHWTLYENGVSVAVSTGSDLSSFSATVNRIGNDSLLNNTNSLLDDIRIFSTAPTQPTIALLASKRGYQPSSSDFEVAGMFGGMSGAMTGGMAS